MKKLYSILLASMILCVACQWKLKPEDEDQQAPLMEVERYDRLEFRYLTTGDFSAIQEMNTGYPIETRTLIEDMLRIGEVTDPEINSKLLKFYQDTTLQMLIADTEARYAKMDDVNRELNAAFTKLKKWFPSMVVPRVYSQISALDQSIVVGNQTIGISLDKYLGEDYPLYKKYYSAAQRKLMKREMILPEAISFYLLSCFPLPNFETRPQIERDLHVGKIQWIANQALDRHVFDNKFVDSVAHFCKSHPKVSYEEMLKMTDFSQFPIEN